MPGFRGQHIHFGKRHKPNLLDQLTRAVRLSLSPCPERPALSDSRRVEGEPHLRVEPGAKGPPKDGHLEEKLHRMEGQLDKLGGKHPATGADLQPRFLPKLPLEVCRRRRSILHTTTWWGPEGSIAKAPVAYHQDAVAAQADAADSHPQPVSKFFLNGYIHRFVKPFITVIHKFE